MKKTHKQVVGLVSLGAVVGITVFAATLPSPGAAATASITDTLMVRVVGSTPDVTFTNPTENATVVIPEQQLEFSYENVDTVEVALKYTDLDGEITNVADFAEINADYEAGTFSTLLNFNDYGYGTFEFTVTGIGFDNVIDVDAIIIAYAPMTSEIVEDEETGIVSAIFDYNDDAAPDKITVTVFGSDGVTPIYTTTVNPPTREVEIPFDDINGIITGNYVVRVVGYDQDGGEIYTKDHSYYYEAIPVPNTGSFLRELNVSREDFLITGLVMFFAISVVGVGIIVKKRHQ